MRNIRVCVRPRIHLGLLSMHRGAPRINGGIGFAAAQPTAHIEVQQGQQWGVRDDRLSPMAPLELEQLANSLELFALRHRLNRQVEVRVGGAMRTHVAMGSATAIRLGALEALALFNELPLSKQDLIAASGRGGTSGIGVKSYFGGGLICDLGRRNDGNGFAPSSQILPAGIPLALPAVIMPEWAMLLCIPRSLRSKTQQEEIAFFRRATPVPAPASFEASYVALFEIYAPIVEGDYAGFCQGVSRMQQTAWKRAERAEYGAPLKKLELALAEAGADCVGMSSLGPMLFCFGKAESLVEITNASDTLDCDMHLTFPANCGRQVSVGHA